MLIDKQIMEHYKNINIGDLCTACHHVVFNVMQKNKYEVNLMTLNPGDVVFIFSISHTEDCINFGVVSKNGKGSMKLSKRTTYGPFIEKIC